MHLFRHTSLFATALLAGFLALSGTPARAQLNSQEQQIVTLLTNAGGQHRPFVQVDPILSQVARARAMDLAKRHYFAHVNPDGHGPNYLVRQAGYALPEGYDTSATGNNIESAAAGDTTASATWNGWMGSPPHKKHLLAEDAFYAEQTSIGVGYYFDPNSDYQYYWVVLTAPPTGSSLTIDTPAANAALTADQVTVTGKSGGSPVATRVVYRLENTNGVGGFRDAIGTKTWTAAITGLAAGPNTVRVRSLDAGGATIKEATRTVRYVVLKPLVVSVEGSGNVTAGYLGTTQRELGGQLSITALPAVGFLFDHWSGGVDSQSAKLSILMREGLVLTAHFRANPFFVRKGAYNGLVQSEPATHEGSGLLKVTTTVTGAFSGQLSLGGKSYPLTGKFDAAGQAQVTILRGLLPPLVATLSLDLAGGTDRITGSVTDGTLVAAFSASQALPANAAQFAGRYTVVLPADLSNPADEIPRGDGYGVLTVSATGSARLSGTLADGRAFSQSASISKDGDLPIYVSLLGGTGSLAGQARLNPAGGTLDGSALWTKPARTTDRYYPAAFATDLDVTGARYTPPPPGVPALHVAPTAANSRLQLEAADIGAAVDQMTTLLPNNHVTIAVPALPKLTLTVTASTGRFTGSFVHPITNTASRISGVILQDRNVGQGFFLGQNEGGAASFVATP
ncbi:MAG: hypothetical protein QOE70_5680 [Chthoniobacter sp.]|jgi:uncharacterized protein YkwD|nr:hypothetical protein [Chthoniobacter sp.]